MSAVRSVEKAKQDPQSKQVRKKHQALLKSALRPKLGGPTRARKVRFGIEHDHDAIRPSLSPTPPLTSTPEENVAAKKHSVEVAIDHGERKKREPPSTPPQHGNVAPEKHSAQALIDHGKREEREELLKRAAKALDARAKAAHALPTPPQSPRGVRGSPFDEPERVLSRKGRKQTKPSATPKNAKPSKETTPLRQGGLVAPTSRYIDVVTDDIPHIVEMPATIDNILIEPNADIKMEEICTAFDFLKARIQTHCREFYSYEKPAENEPIPSFTYLKVKHPELFRYIQYVADGSQYGWQNLLTVGTQRENLVYGIISRALIAHVFDAELFGASAEHEEALLEMCRKYLNFDAFVRNIHRAKIIRSILCEAAEHLTSGKNPASYFSAAMITLEGRLNLLLQPLQDSKSASSSLNLKKSLHFILQASVKIHLAIRLAGSNGTVYRFEHVHKNTRWDGQTMNCINQRKMDLTAHHGEEALVKVACFPAVYATVPSGPNLEQFVDPAFVEEWKMTADEEGSKPTITTFPITLADVVLENTPHDRSDLLTLSQTMAREQARMSDQKLLKLTGINRARNNRINKLVRRAKKTASGAVKGMRLAMTAAGLWYLYRSRGAAAPAILRVLGSLKATAIPGRVTEARIRTVTPITVFPAPPAAAVTTPL